MFSGKLGLVKDVQYKVKTKRTAILVHTMRRLSQIVRKKMKTEIDELLELNVFEPVEASEWGSGMAVVTKKDGRMRLCIDLREVNQIFFSYRI